MDGTRTQLSTEDQPEPDQPKPGGDLVIGDCRLRGREGRWWIGVRAGVIAEISEVPLASDEVVDAAGSLVTESYVNAHLHLDKVYTLDLLGDSAIASYRDDGMGAALASIEQASEIKAHYSEPLIEANARHCIREGIKYGVRHVLAFADVDAAAGLRGIRPLLRLREEYRGVLDLHVVAFPQDGLLNNRGTEDLIRDAVALGADYVGGIPWIEYTDADAAEHVRRMCKLAADRSRGVAMLVDDAGDSALRTTEMLAQTMIDMGLQGQGVAAHARALGLYAKPSVQRLARLAKLAKLGFVTAPHTGPLHAPMFDLLDAGVDVAIGQDDCEDAYYPFGQHNMAEVAFLAAHLLGEMTGSRLDQVFDAVTTGAANVLGVHDHRLAVGSAADLLVHAGDSVREVLRTHTAPRFVVASGRVVARTESTTEYPTI